MLGAIFCVCGIALALTPWSAGRDVLSAPPVMFWSWQHEDDLSSIDPTKSGVCYFVGRCLVKGERIQFSRSLSHLNAPEHVYREVAVRVEVRDLNLGRSKEIAQSLADKITSEALKGASPVNAVQIDFDARLKERPFYRELLKDLRAELPSGVGLSMTALASWCLADDWLVLPADLPVERIVPMFFSMGVGAEQVSKTVSVSGVDCNLLSGRLRPGLSLNEPAMIAAFGSRLADYKGVYLFSSSGWNKNKIEKIKKLTARDM